MLSANKANESAGIVALTFPVLCISGRQVEKGQTKEFRDLWLRYTFLGQIFAKKARNDPKTLFESSKSVKKYNSENHDKVPK